MNFYSSSRKLSHLRKVKTLPRSVRINTSFKNRSRHVPKDSIFSNLFNLFKAQNSLFFQIFAVIILTSAVFIATQGILGGTTLNAQATNDSNQARLLTNFQSVSGGSNTESASKVQEIIIAQEPVKETKPVETVKTQNVSATKNTAATKINKN